MFSFILLCYINFSFTYIQYIYTYTHNTLFMSECMMKYIFYLVYLYFSLTSTSINKYTIIKTNKINKIEKTILYVYIDEEELHQAPLC